MKALFRILALLAVLLLLPWAIKAAGVLPLGSPEFEFLYDRLERADALTLDTADRQLGPYPLALAREALGPFAWLDRLDRSDLRVEGRLGEDFRSAKGHPTVGYESFSGALAARPHDRIFVYGSFRLDEALADDPAYTGKKWRGLAGDIDEAFVHLSAGAFTAALGRYASFWGPRRSLVLAPHAALDGFGYAYRWGRLVLSYRLARLDSLDPDADSAVPVENRYFAGHRLDIHLSRRLRIGFFETAVFGGAGRQVELYYLNPILFYHASQLNDGVDDNTFLGVDFAYEPGRGVQLYGQLLVDDYQVDRASQSDQEPNEIGLLAGAYVAEFLPRLDLRAEYTRVTNRTFNQSHPRNRYTFESELLGAALGNDYDLLDLLIRRWCGEDLAAGVRLAYRRQGEGRVNAAWDTPWLEVEGDYREPFPTGMVEKTFTAALQLRGLLFGHIFVDASFGADRVADFGHVRGDRRTISFAAIKLITFASQALDID